MVCVSFGLVSVNESLMCPWPRSVTLVWTAPKSARSAGRRPRSWAAGQEGTLTLRVSGAGASVAEEGG